METMTWTEALFLTKGGLKGYRERNNINIPAEYQNAARRYMLAGMFWLSLATLVIGVTIGSM